MSEQQLQFGVIFRADNGEMVRVTRENVKETAKYKDVLTETGKAQAGLGGSSKALAGSFKGLTGDINVVTRGANQLIGPLNKLGDHNNRVAYTNIKLAGEAAEVTKKMQTQGGVAGKLGQQLAVAGAQAISGAASFGIMSGRGDEAAAVLSKMDGGASKFARGISGAGLALGGWGLAIELAITGGYALYKMFTDNSDAVKTLTPLTSGLADAQSVLGEMYDLTTGKLKGSNEVIRANIALMEIKLRTDAAVAQAEADKVAQGGLSYFQNTLGGRGGVNREIGELLGLSNGVPGAQFNDQKIKNIFNDVKSGKLAGDKAIRQVDKLPNSIFGDLKFTKTEVLEALGKAITAKDYRNALEGLRNTNATGVLDSRLRKADRSGASQNRQFGREIDTAGAVSIARKAGFQVNSATRPTYIRQEVPGGGSSQERLYNAYIAAGRPKDNPVARPGTSAHEDGNALDIQFGKGVSPDSIRKAYEAEGVRLTKIFKERGHYHIEFGTSGADKAENEAQRLAAEMERLKDFGDQAADKIAQVRGQFDTVPRDVDNARTAIDNLNELMAELAERKPTGFKQMIADAQKLEPLIRESLARPIKDMIADQQRQIEIGEALIDNDMARVEELQFTRGLMQQLGVESESQLATELARRGISGDQVRALYNQLDILREQSRELDIQQSKQQTNLGLLGEFQGGLRDAVRGALGGEGFDAIGNGVERIFEGYLDAFSDSISESLFGDVFRDQEDKIKGVGKVEEAGERLALQVDAAKVSTAVLTTTVDQTKSALGELVDALKGAASAISDIPVAVSGSGDVPGTASVPATEPAPINAVGERSPTKVITDTLKDLLKKVFGPELSADIAGFFKVALQGAAVGQTASGIAQSLGLKQSKLGSQIGGAIGQAVAGPLGAAVGGLLGGTIGGLLKKSKTGSTSISFVDGGFSAGSVSGNTKALQAKSGSLIAGVGGSIASIAEQLGGILTGKAAVSIGYDKKGRVVVDPTGRNRTKGSGVQNFGKDGEGAAQAFATLDALKDGAISGLSAKVASALRSSSDLDKAVREALKVDEIEQLLGGFGSASKKAFVDFERQAKERLRIAGKYGFDLVKLEEENSKQRNKLLNDSIEQATGGLKALLEDLVSGEKAPGTLLDRRDSLLAKKAELEKLAPNDADAAAKLADVLEQLYQVSLEAFGTAGAQFAGDRSGIKSSAEAIIAEATAQLTAAQDKARQNAGTAATEKLIGDGNSILTQIQKLIDEGNGQSAQIIAALAKLNSGGRLGSADAAAINAAYGFGAIPSYRASFGQ